MKSQLLRKIIREAVKAGIMEAVEGEWSGFAEQRLETITEELVRKWTHKLKEPNQARKD